MKTLITFIGGLVILAGGLALTASLLFFAAYRDAGGLSLVMGGVTLLFSASCLFIGIRHLIRKDRNSACEVITVAGFVLWLIWGGRVMEFFRESPYPSGQFTAFVLTTAICIFATKMLKKLVAHRWSERDGTSQEYLSAAGAKQTQPEANGGNGRGRNGPAL